MEFNPIELFSHETQSYIADISAYIPNKVDDLIKVQEATDKSHKLHILLSSWSIQQTQERKLRKLYAICFIVFLGLQLIALNTAFYLIGIDRIQMHETQFNVFFVSMFGEIISLVLIITKYLFPLNSTTSYIEMIKGL